MQYNYRDGTEKSKEVDLLELDSNSNLENIANNIIATEPLVSHHRKKQVKILLKKLQDQQNIPLQQDFLLFKVLRAHILPLTNCSFNKSGDKFITGSYDRTCKVWDTSTGTEITSLEGHRNVVYAISFNNPYGNRVITGSFDKSCRVWDYENSKCLLNFKGHTGEIVCLNYDNCNDYIGIILFVIKFSNWKYGFL